MNKSARRSSIILGAFLVFVLVVSAIVPLFTQNLPITQDVPPPTAAPTATFPAPPDTSAISFEQNYLHPTGLFAIAQPTGWTPSVPSIEPGRAGATLINQSSLSVIEASVEQAAEGFTLDDLDARLSESYLEGSWSRYSDWSETQRRREDDRLILDFTLTLNRQTYVARQITWTDGEWIYTVRVVTPSNATEVLTYVLQNLADSLQPFKVFAGTPFQWTGYYDPAWSHTIRFPSEWRIADSAPGRPASIVGDDGIALRVEAQEGTIADEAAAEAWVTERQSGATILSVEPAERGDAEGFAVAYTFTTVDGEPQSGLAVLLNGPDGLLHTANLTFPGDSVDLNAEPEANAVAAEATPEVEATPGADALPTLELPTAPVAEDVSLAEVMSTFTILPQINLVSAAATPTPLPSPAPTEEVVVEDADADATEAAGEEAEAEPTEATGAETEPAAEATAE